MLSLSPFAFPLSFPPSIHNRYNSDAKSPSEGEGEEDGEGEEEVEERPKAKKRKSESIAPKPPSKKKKGVCGCWICVGGWVGSWGVSRWEHTHAGGQEEGSQCS